MVAILLDILNKSHSVDFKAFIHNQPCGVAGMQRFISAPQYTGKPNRLFNHPVFFSVFFLFFFLFFPLPRADANFDNLPECETATNAPLLPSAYGKVIYRYNENSPKKLYIIGINHRDSQSRLNGNKTAKTQAEVYRIGEWLNLNSKLAVLLPEGFFSTTNAVADLHPVRQSASLDNSLLEQKLTDDSCFVNAEMLLMEHFQTPACQVEDRQLYDAVLNTAVKLKAKADDPVACQSLRAEIDSLQEKRTAAILQKIPEVIEEKFLNGSIKSENALFTIGLNHIGTIINYLEQKTIHIQPPSSNPLTKDDDVADLKLLKEGFGIIIIIPNTLVQDQTIMKMSKLIGFI
jgi:hypothetical protein